METENGARPILKRFLDDEGRVKQLPKKRSMRVYVMDYLADKFEFDRDYTEHEVNALLSQWHTFEDFFILRRELIESGRMLRMRDGSRYWRNKDFVHEPEQQ